MHIALELSLPKPLCFAVTESLPSDQFVEEAYEEPIVVLIKRKSPDASAASVCSSMATSNPLEASDFQTNPSHPEDNLEGTFLLHYSLFVPSFCST